MATNKSNVLEVPKATSPEWMKIVSEGLALQKANAAFNLTRWIVGREIPANERGVVDTHLTPLRAKAVEDKAVVTLNTLRRAVILGSKGFKACLVEGEKIFDADPTTKKSKAGYSGNAKAIGDRIADARCEGLQMKDAIAKAKSVKAPAGVSKVAKAEGAAALRKMSALKVRLDLDAKQSLAYTSWLQAGAAFF